MVTLQTAENVLRDVYLGVIADQINTKTNPLFARIKRSTRNIVGKEVRAVAPVGINGGIMAGEETSELPEGALTPYLSFSAPLKNLYGRFEISDKAVRSSASDVNSFVNLLQDGMDSLLKASIFNLSRMIYGDGSGLLATVSSDSTIDNVESILPGMFVDVYTNGGELSIENAYVASVDKSAKKIVLQSANSKAIADGDKIYLHGSKDNEIIGLKGIVTNNELYGVDRTANPIINARTYTATAKDAFDQEYVQKFIDDLEMNGTVVNFINCSYELKRLYQKYLSLYNKNIDVATLEDGTKVLTHFGTPIVPTSQIGADECYFLNTDDFTFYELGDWRWLEDETGRVLKQHPSKAAYSATLVKYTELICHKPSGVAYCKGIPTTVVSAD